MKSPTAWSLQVFCMSFLCLLTLNIVTGNDTMASTTEVEADTGTKVGSVLPPTDSETISSLSSKPNHGKPEPQKQERSKTDSVKYYGKTDDTTVVLLVLFLIVIILALVYIYKCLNRETDGEYTLTRLINREGGAREHVQNAVRVVESRLGIQLRQRKKGDIEGGKGDEEDMEQERVSEKNAESLAEEAQDEDSSDDYSSLDGCDLSQRKMLHGGSEKSKEGDRASMRKKEEEKREMTREKKEEKVIEEEENCQGGGAGGGLLADLKEFSGSAIWAEEKKSGGEKDGCDLTEL